MTIEKLFTKIERLKEASASSIAEVLENIDSMLKPFFDDNKGLQDAIKAADNSENYTWVYGDEIASWVPFDLTDFRASEGKPCLLSALERYLESEETYCLLEEKNDCLIYPMGQNIIINTAENYIYDQDSAKEIVKIQEYTDEDGSLDYALRNKLINDWMETNGYFPGCYECDNHGSIRLVDLSEGK